MLLPHFFTFMKAKTCKQCGKQFSAQRDDAKFCSSSCRSSFWQNNKQQKNAGENFVKQLKGLVDDKPVKRTVTETIPNKEYLDLQSKLQMKELERKRLQSQKETLIAQLQTLKQDGTGGLLLLGTGTGSLIGYSNAKADKNNPNKRLEGAVKGGILGFCGGLFVELMTKENREKQRQADIAKVNVSVREINVKLVFYDAEIEELKALIGKTKRFITLEKEVEDKPALNLSVQPEKPVLNAPIKREVNVSKQITAPPKVIANVNNGSKIISSAHLTEMEYQALNFTGRWKQFFGLPSINFHCAIHGMAGEGKSTFAIQFANFLAENFGLVIYVSGEEGFSKTMKDKFINNKAATENLYLADLRTYQDLVNEVKPNTYNFIFIDSLDNMRIGASELKELRILYSNSALITISQSTKTGQMRGSYEIVHDSDIAVAVSDGIAEMVKNRFLEKGRTFEIFDIDCGAGITPWNTIRG